MPGTIAVDSGYWEADLYDYSLHFGTVLSTSLYTQLGMTLTEDIQNGGQYTDSSYYYPIQLIDSVSLEYCGTNGVTTHLNGIGLDIGANVLASYTANNKKVYYDDPGMTCYDGNSHESYSGSYQTFLMFDPQTGDSIGVPLKRIAWNWSGAAESSGGWHLTSTSVPSITVNDQDTVNFPVWTNILNLPSGCVTNIDTNCQ